MKCGREPGGKNAKAHGICPAATDVRLNGIHGGKNAGRACWVIAGTFCEGLVQGSFAQKYRDCTLCEFYRMVRREEGSGYLSSLLLLKKVKVLK